MLTIIEQLKKNMDTLASNSDFYCLSCKSEVGPKTKFCPPCEGNRKKFLEKNAFRLSVRKNLLACLARYGIKRRFLNCSFENYESSKRYRQIMANLDTNENLFLWGSPGGGKTHLACAYARFMAWHGIGFYFISVPDLLLEIRSCFSSESKQNESDLIGEYLTPSILILDDMGTEKITEWSLQTLYLIIDGRYADNKQTVFTSNLTLSEIAKTYGDRIASRIGSGVCLKIDGNDHRIKRVK
jgi:DNA replication protein DnaC